MGLTTGSAGGAGDGKSRFQKNRLAARHSAALPIVLPLRAWRLSRYRVRCEKHVYQYPTPSAERGSGLGIGTGFRAKEFGMNFGRVVGALTRAWSHSVGDTNKANATLTVLMGLDSMGMPKTLARQAIKRMAYKTCPRKK